MKPYLIKQPAGMGDIFMCLKIAKILQDKGHPIIWPVYPQHLYLNNYLNIDFKFISTDDNFIGKHDYFRSNSIIERDDYIFLPLETASHIVGEPVMDAKYRLVNIDMSDYLDFFSFKRNEEREKYLFFKILNLMDISKYRLYNRNYASLPDVRRFTKPFVNTGQYLPDIEMYIDQYNNIFDWCFVLENSTEFHTVGTSITFIAEKLNLKTPKIFMYRRPEAQLSNFNVEKKIFKKPWIFVE